MCKCSNIVDQFKGMASLDYASMSNTLTREILVIALEGPETMRLVKDIVEAGKCVATEVKSVTNSEDTTTEEAEEDPDNADSWDIFAADSVDPD